MNALINTIRAVLLLAVLFVIGACHQAYPPNCGYSPSLGRVVCN